MNRKIIIYGSVGITVLVGLFIIVFNLVTKDNPTPEALNFCETYPTALFCTDENASEEAIAEDMFTTIMDSYPARLTNDFCEAYFMGNLITYCKNNPMILFPSNMSLVNNIVTITEVEEGIYDLQTTYNNGSDAYVFRIALTNSLGIFEVSGFSFFVTPEIVDLGLLDEDINTFMVAMIEASDDENEDFCETYFTGLALIACNINPDIFIGDVTVIENYQVAELEINEYTYTVSNVDETITYVYHITFEKVDNTIYISSIEITLI